MQRVTISIDDDLAARFDAAVRDRAYASRSEAVRDLVRRAVDDVRRTSAGTCVASLNYVYDHRTRALAARLLDLQHAHHTLVIAVTHVVLDHDSSLETVLLRGLTTEVEAFADRVTAERGVRFGAVNIVGVETNDHHAEPAPHRHHGHNHASPHPG
ncbi:nickel-responsive transcriptional regulator NikR [Polymorphobacter sp. PAMC 29334]|uniref:nickel-responsive transcriptional regulator NikR n=1 Tax=Polymorphobacter sp. PAMC 29334 TaxID=2862331 RepID=UPI001C78EA11|nr:nickel-responsive transcriptional regulator NikR [Polymorphobacter sp. PAMC 29334]QYE36854.1 nickel-responsive transcriptional regulator NikR [Polymorphobacter sp. PAMC 29334]